MSESKDMIEVWCDQLGAIQFRIKIPDSLRRDFFAGQFGAAVIAQHDKDSGYPSRLASDAAKVADALLAELRRTDAPPEGTEASEPGGAERCVFTGNGPHEVVIEHDGRQAILSLRIKDFRLVIEAYETGAFRLLGTTPMMGGPAGGTEENGS